MFILDNTDNMDPEICTDFRPYSYSRLSNLFALEAHAKEHYQEKINFISFESLPRISLSCKGARYLAIENHSQFNVEMKKE